MKSKKILGLLAAGALMAAVPASLALAEADVTDGASFTEVTDVDGIEGSSFYLYVPSHLENPSPMITPVIYVFGDSAYETEDDAWEALTAAGLDTIAESESGVIIMVNPVGDEWGAEDLDVYEGIMSYISYVDGEVPLTYHTLQYAIGEGSGATFINNYLSKDCKRIAAAMTFGGEIEEDPHTLYALPVYMVSGSEEAADYYMNANDGTADPAIGTTGSVAEARKAQWVTDEEEDKTIYTYSADDVKKVIVSNAESEVLDADLIADCWNTLFRYTARTCLTKDFWQYTSRDLDDVDFVLVNRPNYEEAGMDVVRIDGVGNGIWEDGDDPYWYEFVPAAVQDTMENDSEETYPLIVCFHGGGDHPLFDAESMGWAQLCIDHDIIMVAPNGGGEKTADPEFNQLVDYMIDKYPVDESRIYAVGFSGGSDTATSFVASNPQRFAAMAPISMNIYENFSRIFDYDFDYDYDLPVCIGGQGMETVTTNGDYKYLLTDQIGLVWELDEIAPYEGEYDYNANPYWGFTVEDEERYTTPSGYAIWRGYNYDEDGVPMLALVHSERQTHTHFSGYAELVWDWMSQFSRDTETYEVIYTPND